MICLLILEKEEGLWGGRERDISCLQHTPQLGIETHACALTGDGTLNPLV